MDFVVKMNEAMVMLHEACKAKKNWTDCDKCPFDTYCDAFFDAGLDTPDTDEFLAGVAQR